MKATCYVLEDTNQAVHTDICNGRCLLRSHEKVVDGEGKTTPLQRKEMVALSGQESWLVDRERGRVHGNDLSQEMTPFLSWSNPLSAANTTMNSRETTVTDGFKTKLQSKETDNNFEEPYIWSVPPHFRNLIYA